MILVNLLKTRKKMKTDYRALCEELIKAWDEHGGCAIPYHEACWSLAIDRVCKVLIDKDAASGEVKP
jgi:hypothetical protein